MQINADYAKFTLDEEASVIDRYFQIYIRKPEDPEIQRTMDYVKTYIIDGAGEIKVDVWKHFIDAVVIMGVDLPKVRLNEQNPRKGSCYTIYSTDDPRHLKRKANRRKRRIREVENCRIRYGLASPSNMSDNHLKLVSSR